MNGHPEHFCYDHFKVISFMQANSQRLSSRRNISSEAGGRVELILKRVRFQIGEPRTDGDISVNLCKWGWGKLRVSQEIITTG